MSLGPFDLTGGPFLALYSTLFACTLLAAFVIPRLMRPEGRARTVGEEDQLAYLAGGASRLAEALVARMLSTGALVMTGRDAFAVGSREAVATSAERDILGLHSPFRWKAAERAFGPHVEQIERRMVAGGLLMTDAEARRIRLRVVLPFVMLLVFGVTKLIVGILRDRPVGFLIALLIATVVCAIIFANVDRRTRAGHDALAAAKQKAGRLVIAPTSPEVGLAVALFGTTVLAGSGWDAFHRLRTASDSGGGTGGDGGCGGGGGGCGGCGS
jgi:uncharacterized protein (TIGR04222 family)